MSLCVEKHDSVCAGYHFQAVTSVGRDHVTTTVVVLRWSLLRMWCFVFGPSCSPKGM